MFLLLLYPKHVIKMSEYNLGCYTVPIASSLDASKSESTPSLYVSIFYSNST